MAHGLPRRIAGAPGEGHARTEAGIHIEEGDPRHAIQEQSAGGVHGTALENLRRTGPSARRPVAGGRSDFAGASAETQRRLSLRPGEQVFGNTVSSGGVNG